MQDKTSILQGSLTKGDISCIGCSRKAHHSPC